MRKIGKLPANRQVPKISGANSISISWFDVYFLVSAHAYALTSRIIELATNPLTAPGAILAANHLSDFQSHLASKSDMVVAGLDLASEALARGGPADRSSTARYGAGK
jgi:hypothetical protein